jgi:hypothetical protein
MERFIRSGKGFVGIHSASDTEYDWDWYTKLVGRMFHIHPTIQTAKLKIFDDKFPGLQGLSDGKLWTEEWYEFGPEKVSDLHYILGVDESTYNPKVDWGAKKGQGWGEMHPVAWYHMYDGGRSFYTALGHLPTDFSDPAFLKSFICRNFLGRNRKKISECEFSLLFSFFFLFLFSAQDSAMVIPLWPGGAPGFENRKNEKEEAKDWWVKNIHNPSLTVFLPPKDIATGAAAVVCPGGGFRTLVFDAEGKEAAKFLNSIGVAAFVLKYRLFREENSPYKGRECKAGYFRAMRLVRSVAKDFNIDTSRIGVMGFSAGGEMAGWDIVSLQG